MIKNLARVANTTYFVLLTAKTAAYLAGAVLLLFLAGWLAYIFMDDGLFLIIPALVVAESVSLVLRALEPFASKRFK